MAKHLIGDCVSNPFGSVERLTEVIDEGVEISKRSFVRACALDDETLKEMRRFPYDYEFCKSGEIYFYTWSAIEHFFN